MPRKTFEQYKNGNSAYRQAYIAVNPAQRSIIEAIYNVANRALAETQLWIPVPANRIQILKATIVDIVNAYLWQKYHFDGGTGAATQQINGRLHSDSQNPCLFLMKGFFAMFARTGNCGDMAAGASFFMARELGRLCFFSDNPEFIEELKKVEITIDVEISTEQTIHHLCKIELPNPQDRAQEARQGIRNAALDRYHKLTSWYVDPWIQEIPVSQYYGSPRYKMKTGYPQTRYATTSVEIGALADRGPKFTLNDCDKLRTLFVTNGRDVYHKNKPDIIAALNRLNSSPTRIITFKNLKTTNRPSLFNPFVAGVTDLIATLTEEVSLKKEDILRKLRENETKYGDKMKIVLVEGVYFFFGGGFTEARLAKSLLGWQIQTYYNLTYHSALPRPSQEQEQEETKRQVDYYPTLKELRPRYLMNSDIPMLEFIKKIIFD